MHKLQQFPIVKAPTPFVAQTKPCTMNMCISDNHECIIPSLKLLYIGLKQP